MVNTQQYLGAEHSDQYRLWVLVGCPSEVQGGLLPELQNLGLLLPGDGNLGGRLGLLGLNGLRGTGRTAESRETVQSFPGLGQVSPGGGGVAVPDVPGQIITAIVSLLNIRTWEVTQPSVGTKGATGPSLTWDRGERGEFIRLQVSGPLVRLAGTLVDMFQHCHC